MLKKFKGLFIIAIIAICSVQAQAQKEQQTPETHEKFDLGMAGYNFRKMDIDATLDYLSRLNITHFCIKTFHLPFESTDAEIAAFKQKLSDKGVVGYGVGPIYMKSEKQVDETFEYAKRVGVKVIVGVPNYELLPYVEKKIIEYDMKLAIHLHGPDQEIYQDAEVVWEQVKNFDKRIGMCLDIGHDTRNGKDPVADLEKYIDRVFDIHLKDVTAPDKTGRTVVLGHGIIDLPSFVKMLRKVNYSGSVSLEYEKNPEDNLIDMAECIGYFRGILNSTK